LRAAQREVRHRLALGQFAPDDPTPEQLLDIALQQAWRERRRLSQDLGIKALALAAIFRTGEAMGAREAERRRRPTELLPEEVEPDPLYHEDDEDFWQSYELDYPRNTEVFSGTVDRPREDAANDDELVGRLAPASVKSCSCTRSTAWHWGRLRWHSPSRRPRRSSSWQAPAAVCAVRAG
jgi:hypothetical protein